jgi:hypothetical protein
MNGSNCRLGCMGLGITMFLVVESCEIGGVMGCDCGGVCVRNSGILGERLSHSGGEGLWSFVGCFLVTK